MFVFFFPRAEISDSGHRLISFGGAGGFDHRIIKDILWKPAVLLSHSGCIRKLEEIRAKITTWIACWNNIRIL